MSHSSSYPAQLNFVIKTGDRLPPLRIPLLDATGLPRDLTSVANIKLVVAQVVGGRRTVDLGTMTVYGHPFDGIAEYQWPATGLVPGEYLMDHSSIVFLMSREGAQAMVPNKSGRIINIASVLGLVPMRLQSSYVAAKAGVVNLTRTMAIELGAQGILTNCIAPGSILTEGTRRLFYADDGQFSDRVKGMLAHVPLGRPGRCDEIAHAVLFLAAPESSYINGAVLPVDGGWLAG